MDTINWNAKRHVYVNRTFSVAFVKSSGGYVEFDDYREHGGQVINPLPPYSEFVGTFTHREIADMDYPE